MHMEERTAVDGAVTRRQALRDMGAAGLGLGALGGGLDALLASAASAAPRTGTLKDIEHVIILMQENRSFDHYFGTYAGVRGFADKKGRAAFFQKTSAGPTVHPFHLTKGCLPDISHDWGPQHRSWNAGKMNGFITAREPTSVNGHAVAAETMGYYTGSDLRFYHALADAFTICEDYYCSVIGPTDPNRLMSMTATIDPAGQAGGPLIQTNTTGRVQAFGWRTMPEQLSARGISWTVYTDPGGGILDNVLVYFKQYRAGSRLAALGLEPTYPADFMSDLSRDRLPQVSWILTSVLDTEHPDFSTPQDGEAAARTIVEAILSHPKVWKKTALFITWDENGGFFDHVPPPTPPKGTPGEYLTVPKLPSDTTSLLGDAEGIRGPIGLGFRVPMIVVSPFSRGGLVCSDTFDHTSTLRFLETRFGVRVPNLSAWRRRTTGDLTSAFNFAASPRFGRPSLAKPRGSTGCTPTTSTPVASTAGPFPKQSPGKRGKPSGIVKKK
jgi:phospholipase C